jgi:hypothetical protein
MKKIKRDSGQELRRISTIHSSSLCALLFFYHVSIYHPLFFEVDGEAAWHCKGIS